MGVTFMSVDSSLRLLSTQVKLDTNNISTDTLSSHQSQQEYVSFPFNKEILILDIFIH